MDKCMDFTIAMKDCIAEHREYYGELFSEENSDEDDDVPFEASSFENQEVEEHEEQEEQEQEKEKEVIVKKDDVKEEK